MLSFGGPAGQIAVMHRILVEEKRWLGDARFLHALNFCMLLPGPEAQQLATYIGWLMHGVRGGLIAGVLFILPGAVSILLLSWLYLAHGEAPLLAAAFWGLKTAVLAIILQAVLRIGGRALHGPLPHLLAAGAFLALFTFGLPFPVVVLLAGLIGLLVPQGFAPGGHGAHKGPVVADADTVLGVEGGGGGVQDPRAARRAGIFALLLWLLPIGALWLTLGPDNTFTLIATFFGKLAVLTFGGAYAVLAWVAQAAVETYGWLRPGEMLDGLGLAETTPGPLIMVTQFVGHLAGARAEGADPFWGGMAGAILTTWVTFTPCFAWIFLGAPHIERLRGNEALTGALAAVTAAVVGVILSLGLWFGIHVLFGQTRALTTGLLDMDLPVWSTLDPLALLLTLIAAVALMRFKLSVPVVLATTAVAGILLRGF